MNIVADARRTLFLLPFALLVLSALTAIALSIPTVIVWLVLGATAGYALSGST